MKFLVCITLVAALILADAASAHEDPRGDVHPRVSTAAGRFEVYFENNREAVPRLYRTVYSAEGKLISTREPFVGAVPNGLGPLPDFSGDPAEGTSILSLVIKPTGKDRFEHREFHLPAGAYTDCRVLSWEPKFVSRDSPANASEDGTWPFSLRIFEFESGKLVDSTVIGNPARIYMFARTSPVLSAEDELLVAWMEERKFPDEQVKGRDGSDLTVSVRAHRVVLTRWQPKLRKTLHTILATADSNNVSFGIGRINNIVVVAWHEFGKIRVEVVDLGVAQFVARLPELRLDK